MISIRAFNIKMEALLEAFEMCERFSVFAGAISCNLILNAIQEKLPLSCALVCRQTKTMTHIAFNIG